jgi:hypothetical protein
MNPPTNEKLAYRLDFAGELIAATAQAILANIEHLQTSTLKARLNASCQKLTQISCVYQQTAAILRSQTTKGQQTAAIGSRKPHHQVPHDA